MKNKILKETKVEARKQFPEMTEEEIADVAYQICALSEVIVESYFIKLEKKKQSDLDKQAQ